MVKLDGPKRDSDDPKAGTVRKSSSKEKPGPKNLIVQTAASVAAEAGEGINLLASSAVRGGSSVRDYGDLHAEIPDASFIEAFQPSPKGDSGGLGGIRKFPLETQTLYAELLEHLRGAEFARSFADLKGGFTIRKRGEEQYWYFRSSEGPNPSPQEFYVGPDDERTRDRIRAYKEGRENAKAHADRVIRLAAMLRSGGLTIADQSTFKILKGFSNAGVFRLGGVLVGTHAYAAIGNSLGVRWPSATQTQDVDFGAMVNPHVGIGLPLTQQTMANVPKAIESLEMGFLPVHFPTGEKPTTYVVPNKEWRIDFITAPRGKDRVSPIEITRLGLYAQPLEFMGYALDKTMEAVVVGTSGVLVRVPEPARFAIHKLLVASNRDARSAIKAEKDRLQSLQLMRFLEYERPGDITIAAEDAISKGSGWRRRIQEQTKLLKGSIEELNQTLQ